MILKYLYRRARELLPALQLDGLALAKILRDTFGNVTEGQVMGKKKLKAMQAAHANFMAGWLAAGRNTVDFNCPCCECVQTTTAPAKRSREVWTSAAICTTCGALYFKSVAHNKVTVEAL